MIELESIITNNHMDIEKIKHFTDKGFKFVITLPAKIVHPYASETDKFSIFSRYTNPNIREDMREYERTKNDNK